MRINRPLSLLLCALPLIGYAQAPGLGLDQIPTASVIGDTGLVFGYQPGSGGSGALICARGWCPVSYTLLQLKTYVTGGVVNATQINGAAVPASQTCLGSNSGSQLVAGSCGAAPNFSTVLSGTNANNLVMAGTLTFTGGGVINANEINGLTLPLAAPLLATNGGGQIVASTALTGGTVSLAGNLAITGGGVTIGAGGTTAITLPPALSFTAGYLGIPLTGGAALTTGYTFALADSGTMAVMNCGSPCTLTIPANSSIAFPVGQSVLTVFVVPGSSTVTLAITTDTLYWSPSLATGSRTLPAGAIFSVFKYGTTTWVGTGQGAS